MALVVAVLVLGSGAAGWLLLTNAAPDQSTSSADQPDEKDKAESVRAAVQAATEKMAADQRGTAQAEAARKAAEKAAAEKAVAEQRAAQKAEADRKAAEQAAAEKAVAEQRAAQKAEADRKAAEQAAAEKAAAEQRAAQKVEADRKAAEQARRRRPLPNSEPPQRPRPIARPQNRQRRRRPLPNSEPHKRPRPIARPQNRQRRRRPLPNSEPHKRPRPIARPQNRPRRRRPLPNSEPHKRSRPIARPPNRPRRRRPLPNSEPHKGRGRSQGRRTGSGRRRPLPNSEPHKAEADRKAAEQAAAEKAAAEQRAAQKAEADRKAAEQAAEMAAMSVVPGLAESREMATHVPCSVLDVTQTTGNPATARLRIGGLALPSAPLDAPVRQLASSSRPVGLDTQRLALGQCPVIAVVADAARRARTDTGLRIAIGRHQVAQGERLTISLRGTANATRLIDIYGDDKMVRHVPRPGATAEWTAVGPPGRRLLVALAVPATFNLERRPEAEDTAAYLTFLRSQFDRLASAGADAPLADLALFEVSAPAPPPPPPGPCKVEFQASELVHIALEKHIKMTLGAGLASCRAREWRDGFRAYDTSIVGEQPQHGRVLIANDESNSHTEIFYYPERGFVGQDRFSYRLLPGNGARYVEVTIGP